jgi:hypothetical protein
MGSRTLRRSSSSRFFRLGLLVRLYKYIFGGLFMASRAVFSFPSLWTR